jgi:DNA repair photolyase
MNGKEVFYRTARTVLTFGPAFQEKGLCDGITLNAGDACAYSCSYCYVPAQMRKLLYNILGDKPHVEAVVRRRNAIALLTNQLLNAKGEPKYLHPDDTRVVYTSTLVDVAGNTILMQETVDLLKIILQLTHWHVRLLSKSNLLPKLVREIPEQWHHRLILGVSTGTFSDVIGKAIEKGTAPVSKRLASLHWLQDNGFRTFGMVCPSLPQENYRHFAEMAASAIRSDQCEHVWAEVINVRGESFHRTCEALTNAGLTSEASALKTVMGDTEQWEKYARETFEAHTQCIPPSKLRFLQCVHPLTIKYWRAQRQKGALLLGKHAEGESL